VASKQGVTSTAAVLINAVNDPVITAVAVSSTLDPGEEGK
jgi:hypothetical protein